ncbi:hypothetical protein FS749_009490 [Ceratobasidium sp. UAMH 11750]|nr:hypothetical protein FS749_009490 [Ceratobasidium sp. UAMH 11750]
MLSGCDGEAVTAARSILDFMYRAHLPELSEDDLDTMDRNLETFHGVKHIFVDPDVNGLLNDEDQFNNIAKIHMLSHYTRAIRELGVPDGYNTEATERLHIDYVKIPWRDGNHVNATQQIATYLQRKESWVLLRAYLHDTGQLLDPRFDEIDPVDEIDDDIEEEEGVGDELEGEPDDVEDRSDEEEVWYPTPSVWIAKRPAFTRRGVDLIAQHKATDLIPAIRRFLTSIAPPGTILPLTEHANFKVWTRCKLRHKRLPFVPSLNPQIDHVRAKPGTVDHEGREMRHESFDVVLFSPSNEDATNTHGIHRFHAGRVRAIFELPRHLLELHPHKLVYIEQFHPFSNRAPQPMSLYTTSHMIRNDRRCALVVPLSQIRMACDLAPRYQLLGPEYPISSSTDLLSAHKHFYLNKYASEFQFVAFDHWDKHR